MGCHRRSPSRWGRAQPRARRYCPAALSGSMVRHEVQSCDPQPLRVLGAVDADLRATTTSFGVAIDRGVRCDNDPFHPQRWQNHTAPLPSRSTVTASASSRGPRSHRGQGPRVVRPSRPTFTKLAAIKRSTASLPASWTPLCPCRIAFTGRNLRNQRIVADSFSGSWTISSSNEEEYRPRQMPEKDTRNYFRKILSGIYFRI